MSAPSEEPEEPDLTALLDLVLQLVMFFLAVARIDSEQRDQSVVLPQASIARSLTKDYNKIVIINMYPASKATDEEKAKADPNARASKLKYTVFEGFTTTEYTSDIAVKNNLKDKFAADQKATKPDEWATGKGRSLIVLRAHKDSKFDDVFKVMQAAREVGFTDIQLRAYVAGVAPR
jgi:biopolymer transport protein ExbD